MKSEGNLLVRIAVSLFIVLCVVSIIELQLRMNKLNDEKQELTQKVEEIREEIEELQYRMNLPYNDDYAARVARMQLGYHFPDEILFINDLYEN